MFHTRSDAPGHRGQVVPGIVHGPARKCKLSARLSTDIGCRPSHRPWSWGLPLPPFGPGHSLTRRGACAPARFSRVGVSHAHMSDSDTTDSERTLTSRLTDIQGVGDATAGKILDSLERHESAPSASGVDVDALRDEIAAAHDYHHAGDHEYAEKFVRRAFERVCDGDG